MPFCDLLNGVRIGSQRRRNKDFRVSIVGTLRGNDEIIVLMNRKRSYFFAAGLLAFVLVCAAAVSSEPRARDIFSYVRSPLSWQAPVEDSFLVTRVVDGDTIELESGEKVRYIGIDTPETVKPGWPVECFGKEASKRNRELVEGKWVTLASDVSDRDRYGRWLRFVYLPDGTFVNDLLVREGYARVSSFPPDISKQDVFLAAERDARAAKRGLWADGACPR